MLAAKLTTRWGVRVPRLLTPILLLIFFVLPQTVLAQDLAPDQAADLFHNELEIIRLINQERRGAGLPPLAWNAELTAAARAFAFDTIENRDQPYCGHVDSQGHLANQRLQDAGYLQIAGSAENSLCGYLAPAAAVKAWMNSAPHRANILNADLREVGAGYYRSAKGAYVVLDLAVDGSYAPLVINDEAATTTDAQVQLYLYDQDSGEQWHGVGATLAMMIANTPDFAGAQWEPYAETRTWTLLPGEGWRTVYVKTRDRLGRTTIVHDSIYLGSAIPDTALSLDYATQVEAGLVLDPLDAGGYSHIQFSLNWLADDSDENFVLSSGVGTRINDAAAVGGNAFRLAGGGAPALARNGGANPLGQQAAVAYFRLKTSDNSGAAPVATLTINDGGSDVAVRTLAANEFTVAGQYQEFAVPFTPAAAANGLLTLQVARTGFATLDWDTTVLYTAPQAAVTPYAFRAPGGYYRSSGVQARLLTPAGGTGNPSFSAPLEVYPHLHALNGGVTPVDLAVQVNPTALVFAVPSPAAGPLDATVALTCPACGDDLAWIVVSDAAWLTATVTGGYLQVQVDPVALATNVHLGTLTLAVTGRQDIKPITLTITLLFGELEVLLPNRLFIPAVTRR